MSDITIINEEYVINFVSEEQDILINNAPVEAVTLEVRGLPGGKGDTGEGLPVGGEAGQVATKQSNADFDIIWQSPLPSEVTSVNGQNGIVVLDSDDIEEGSANLYTNAADVARLVNTSGNNTGDQDLSPYLLIADLPSNLSDFNNDTGFITNISSFSTSDLVEGSGLYFTASRAITALSGQNLSLFNNDVGYLTTAVTSVNGQSGDITIDTLSSEDVVNLSNLSGVNSGDQDLSPYALLVDIPTSLSELNNDTGFITNLVGFSTTDLNEGSNLYFTDARAQAAVDTSGLVPYDGANQTIDLNAQALNNVGQVNIETPAISGRESLLTGKISQGFSTFGVGNLTTTNNRFLPAFYGFNNDDNRSGLGFLGLINNDNDSLGTLGAIDFNVGKIATDSTDPLNANRSALSSHSAVTFRNNANTLLTVFANGNATATGDITANNISGVNTGDQDLNPYALISSLGTAAFVAVATLATAAQGSLADTALQSGDNISELVNNTGYITDLSSFDTDDLVEGVNKYTNAADITRLANTSGTNTGDQDLSPYALLTDVFSGEYADLTGAPTNLSDFTNDVGFIADLSSFSTTDLAEGSNLYFTEARSRAALSAGTGITYNAGTGVITNSAPDQTVSITAGTNIESVTGTYPNFTVNAANQSTAAAGAAGQVQYNDGSNGFTASPNFAFDGANTLTLGDANGANIGVNNTYSSGYNFGTANTTGNATATTIGNENTANGVRQTIVGSRNNGGSLSDTVLVGFDNIISGFFGFANTVVGNGCTVGTGGFTTGSTAIGFNCSTNGSTGSLAIGVSCAANGSGSIAAGNSVTNSNGNSYKFGFGDANSILMSDAGIVSSYGQQWQVDGSELLPNVVAEPATPVGGGVTYVQNGELRYKGSSGTVTVLGAA